MVPRAPTTQPLSVGAVYLDPTRANIRDLVAHDPYAVAPTSYLDAVPSHVADLAVLNGAVASALEVDCPGDGHRPLRGRGILDLLGQA